MRKIYCSILFFVVSGLVLAQEEKSPLDDLPDYIKRITYFGERADWSHDGNRILFIEKTFGDVFEVEVETGIIKPMTHHFFHEGFIRALYLSNGDILLSGARDFDAQNPWKSRDARNAELWVLKGDLSGPPTAIGLHCKEGPAVSRKNMNIAWAIQSTIYKGEIVYADGKPKLKNESPLFQSSDLPSPVNGWNLETQNFHPYNEEELFFTPFAVNLAIRPRF